MQFSDVVTALQQGQFAQRAGWAATGEYIALLPGIQHIWKVTTTPNVSAGNCLFSVDDMIATDWALYPQAPSVPSHAQALDDLAGVVTDALNAPIDPPAA